MSALPPVRGAMDRTGSGRLEAVLDGQELDLVADAHEAAPDHPYADAAPAGGQGPGHPRLGQTLDVAARRAGAVVGEGRLADPEGAPDQRPQVDAPGDDVAPVLPVLHGHAGGGRDVVEVLAPDQRHLALLDVRPIAPSGGVAGALEPPAGHGPHLADRPHGLPPGPGHEHPLYRPHRSVPSPGSLMQYPPRPGRYVTTGRRGRA